MLSIGDLSAATGVKVPTIRHYEQIELLPKGARDKGNRRRWSEAAVLRLTFIRAARVQGLTVEAIRDLLRVAALPAAQSAQANSAVKIQLAAVQQKISSLEQMREVLADATSCAFRGIGAVISRDRGRLFHGIAGSRFAVAGRLVDAFMESGLSAEVKGFRGFAAHAFA